MKYFTRSTFIKVFEKSSMDLIKYVIVGLISASPVGEFLIAYPVAITLGLDPLISVIICILFNLLPIPILIFFINKIRQKFPRFFNWASKRAEVYRKYVKSFGLIAFVILTPIIGVYATTIALVILGFKKIEAFSIQGLSLIIYGAVSYLITVNVI